MSATVYISSDRSGSHALSYANSKARKPHYTTDKLTQRVLKSGYVGCDEDNYRKRFADAWKKADTKKRGLIETYTIRQSFDPKYSYENPQDVAKVNKIGVALARKLYPGRLAVVATQADGVGHKLHNHIVICSPNPVTGRCIHGRQKNFSWVSKQNDKVLADFGDTPLKTPVMDARGRVNAPEKIGLKAIEQARPYVYKTNRVAPKGTVRVARLTPREQIKKAIKESIKSGVTSFDAYQKDMKTRGIDVIYRYTKSGELRKRISYHIINSPAKHNFSSRSLGENYERDKLEQLFRQNEQQKQQQTVATIFNGFRRVEQNHRKFSADSRERRSATAIPRLEKQPTRTWKKSNGFAGTIKNRQSEHNERVEAIRQYQEQFERLNRRDQFTTRSRQGDWFEKWWNSLANTSIIDELKQFFAKLANPSRNAGIPRAHDKNKENGTGRTQSNGSRLKDPTDDWF